MNSSKTSPLAAYGDSHFCWADLGVVSSAAGRRFYCELFAWQLQDVQIPQGAYGLFQQQGRTVCALYGLDEDSVKLGAPAFWQSYLAVSDIERQAKRLRACGAELLTPVLTVADYGWALLFRDPQGAVAGLWQPQRHKGADIMRQIGALCWFELHAAELEQAVRFYCDAFAWSSHWQGQATVPYFLCRDGDGNAVAGLIAAAQDDAGKQAISGWLPYFLVADCRRSVALAESLGGRLLLPPTVVPERGVFSCVQDPQGAVFALCHWDGA